MSEQLKIKLSIANRVYPLTIAASQEEGLRIAAQKIDATVKKFEQSYSVQDKQLLKEGLQSLAAIEEVRHLIIGEPAPTFDREVIASDWHVSEVIYFDSVAAQDAYQVDPIHQLFVTNYSHLWSKVVVYDILID